MPGQALTEFLRSGCETEVGISNTHSDCAGEELGSILTFFTVPNQAQCPLLVVPVHTQQWVML